VGQGFTDKALRTRLYGQGFTDKALQTRLKSHLRIDRCHVADASHYQCGDTHFLKVVDQTKLLCMCITAGAGSEDAVKARILWHDFDYSNCRGTVVNKTTHCCSCRCLDLLIEAISTYTLVLSASQNSIESFMATAWSGA
jgi:hypothetical protein